MTLALATSPRAITPGKLAQIVGRGNWKPAPHLNLINRELMVLAQKAELCQSYNLAVFAPPRHGKSRLLTIIFVLWYLCTFPTRQVIVASHSASLAADEFGAAVLDLMLEFGGPIFGREVRSDRRAKDDWTLTDGGRMRSVGVGGSLVGLGADLFVFDDIIASAKEAMSKTIRDAAIDWYLSTARTRINPNGQQIFTMQRWHGQDPAQRVVLDHPGKWGGDNGRTIVLTGIADHDPSKGEVDPIGRQVGDALWPPMWPLAKLEEIRDDNQFWFAAQYQQRPVPRGGGMIKLAWIEDNAVHYIPEGCTARVRWWDRAATEGGGDYSVGVRLSRKGHHYYIECMKRDQWGSTNRDLQIKATCSEDNRAYPNAIVTWGEQEPGSSGKDSALAFEKMLAPHAAHCETSTGSKEIRADGLAGAFGRGEIHVYMGPHEDDKPEWYDEFVAELTTFPVGKHEDIVDALSGAYNKLALADGDRESASCHPDSDAFAEYGGVVTF